MKTRLLLWELAIFRIHFLFQIQGGRLGTSLFKGFYRAFNRNDQLSNKESICDHEKATPYLELSDFSHPFLLSNLTISRNVQFPNINRFDNRFDIQFPPTGGPRIRKLAIFAETRKTGKTRKTRNFSARFLIWKSDENGANIFSFFSFSSFSSFFSFSENF